VVWENHFWIKGALVEIANKGQPTDRINNNISPIIGWSKEVENQAFVKVMGRKIMGVKITKA
jgi:hypothetical protein